MTPDKPRLLLFLGLLCAFLFGPQAVLAIGAALGGVGGGTPPGDYWSVSVNEDAGLATNSIEFTGEECAALDAGTSPSGWLRRSVYVGEGVDPYNNFTAVQYYSDCNKTRPGHMAVQMGATQPQFIRRTAALSENFTIYLRYSLILNGGNTHFRSNNLIIGAVGTPTTEAAACYMWASFAGTAWEGYAERFNGGAGTIDTVRTYSINAFRPTIMVMQKSGTSMRCFIGDDSGNYHYLGGHATNVPITAGNNYVELTYGNLGATSFPAGNPILLIDYIRVVDGNGNYFP